jgi:hypothetical protein
MGKRTGADLVPVQDVWATDEELAVSPVRRYDWATLAEKAMNNPGKWLLVDEDGSPSTVSNVNNGLIAGLRKIGEVEGYQFQGRASDTYNVGRHASKDKPRRCKVWLMAVQAGPKR